MAPSAINNYISTLPPATFGLAKVTSANTSPLELGLHHLNFKITVSDGQISDSFVIRIPAAENHPDALANEHWYIGLLDAGITPESVYYDQHSSLGYPLLITRFIPGKHLPLATLSHHRIRQLAGKLRHIHAIHRPRFSRGDAAKPDHLGSLRDFAASAVADQIDTRYQAVAMAVPHDRALFEQARHLLAQQLRSPDTSWDNTTFSLCHGDINAGNLLWTARGLRLIDWDGANFGDPANDVAYIFAINNVSHRWQQQFLDSYLQANPQPDISPRLDTYILKNRLADLVWSIGKIHETTTGTSLLNLSSETCQQMYNQRHRNLQRYLAGI